MPVSASKRRQILRELCPHPHRTIIGLTNGGSLTRCIDCGADTDGVQTAQHTPGPWVVDEKSVALGVGRHGRTTVYEIRNSPDLMVNNREVVANARLIAAAPDLLAALESIIDADGRGEQAVAIARGQAHAAIKRARGEA